MAKELKRIDISNIPELLSIAQEVRSTNEPRILSSNSSFVGAGMPTPTCLLHPSWASWPGW